MATTRKQLNPDFLVWCQLSKQECTIGLQRGLKTKYERGNKLNEWNHMKQKTTTEQIMAKLEKGKNAPLPNKMFEPQLLCLAFVSMVHYVRHLFFLSDKAAHKYNCKTQFFCKGWTISTFVQSYCILYDTKLSVWTSVCLWKGSAHFFSNNFFIFPHFRWGSWRKRNLDPLKITY